MSTIMRSFARVMAATFAALPSRFLGGVKTNQHADPLIRAPEPGHGRMRINYMRPCGDQHLFRFVKTPEDVRRGTYGLFKCARCNHSDVLPIKHKPHHDKINFRRSDPRHPQFNQFHAPVTALKEAA